MSFSYTTHEERRGDALAGMRGPDGELGTDIEPEQYVDARIAEAEGCDRYGRNPLDDHRELRAEVTVREWGEPDRVQEIGPYSPYDPDVSDDDACAWLEDTLRRQGDDVIRVWVA